MEYKKEASKIEFRSIGIDALRVFACIAIVAWHILANGDFIIEGYFVEKVIPSWNDLVYLFMIVSGFGMCSGYYMRMKNHEISLEEFYKKRYTKILPFFAVLVVTDVFMEHSLESIFEGFIELTLVFGFLPNNEFSVIGVAWTIGVIFAFYIVFPFVVFLISNKRRAWGTLAATIVIQILCKTYFMTDKFVVSGYNMKHHFLFCMPYFMIGCLIFLYKKNIIELIKRYGNLSFFCCLFITLVYYMADYIETFSVVENVEVMILYGAWVIFGVGTRNRLFCNKIVKYISGISMEIYLSHMVCFRIIQKLGILELLGAGVLAYCTTIFIILLVLIVSIPFVQKIIELCLQKMRIIN